MLGRRRYKTVLAVGVAWQRQAGRALKEATIVREKYYAKLNQGDIHPDRNFMRGLSIEEVALVQNASMNRGVLD